MQVKVFESENMDAALRQIKKEFGPDALILSSRTVRKGGLGLFGKPVLEVTAAIDGADQAAADAPVAPVTQPTADKAAEYARIQQAALDNSDDIDYQQVWSQTSPADEIQQPAQQVPRPDFRPDPYQNQNRAGRDNDGVEQLQREVGQLREMISSLVDELPAKLEQMARPQLRPLVPPYPVAGGGAEGEDETVRAALTRLGIEAEAAHTIAHYARNNLSARQIADPAVLNAFFVKTIAELVQTTGSLLPQPGERKLLSMIGPTGVGKTTTIAKLAAAYLLSGGRQVALVTIDTYRIAAVEQLKVYGEIMNLPVEVVMNCDELKRVLERHSNKDLILIDTAGRSPKDDVSLRELQEFMAVDDAIEPHLVLSATTRERDLYEIYNRFSVLEPRSLLVTKLDECDSLGVLLNIHLRNNCPLSYLANGQKVPEDLVLADAELVSAMILERSEG